MSELAVVQEASTIAALVDDLKTLGHHMSDRAWRVNKRQRLALGCLRHPSSQLTREMLASSGVPPVGKTLPRTSLADVATAAVPIAAWNRRERDDLIRSLLRKGEVKRALTLLRRLAVNYPTDPRTWIALAELRLFYDADVGAARVRCRAALEALSISRSQLKSLISLGHDHSDKLRRLDLIKVHVRPRCPCPWSGPVVCLWAQAVLAGCLSPDAASATAPGRADGAHAMCGPAQS